jgi:DNA invertase Pin-like site-specific DNA recombinase
MHAEKIPVALLVRVSTQRQQTDRQVSELRSFALSKGFEILEICEEKISGRASAGERSGLLRILELAESGLIRKVLVHEISRVGRKNSVTHRFVEELIEKGVSLYWKSQDMETILPNGKRNPAAGLVLALLSEMALAESETIRDRISSGLAQARIKGVKLGRPSGTTMTSEQRLEKHRDIVRLIRAGHSVRNMAKITGKSTVTVQRTMKALKCLVLCDQTPFQTAQVILA